MLPTYYRWSSIPYRSSRLKKMLLFSLRLRRNNEEDQAFSIRFSYGRATKAKQTILSKLQSCILYTRLRVISGYKFVSSGTKRYRIFCLQYQPGITKAGKARIYNKRGVMRRTISIDKIAISSLKNFLS